MRARRFIFSSILVLLFFSIEGQEVIISEEFNLKNDFFYELVGNLDERVFLFRDKGFRHEMYIFNEYLELVDAVELGFEKRKIDVYGMCSFNNEFHLIYSYKHKGDQIVKINRYDSRVRLVGEDTILQRPFPLLPSWARFTISEDKSQVLLFRFEFEDKLEMMSYDLKDRKLNWTRKHDFKDPGARRDFRKILISNEGKVYVIQEKNNSKVRRKRHILQVFEFSESNSPIYTELNYEENISADFEARYDEKNNKIVIGGLYGNGPDNISEGYYFASFSTYESNPKFSFQGLDEAFIESIETSGIFKRKKGLDNFEVKEIILRNDGGALLMTEMSKELSRRSTYTGRGGGIRYIDFFNEDIAIIALNPSGEEHWKTILHKKQFSQDDGAIYSSFFTFKTPSSLRIIYNDEVRNDNTVSEYLINPLGEIERKNVLNTQYQRLKLRFQDAIQLSSNAILVPSERGNKLVLVRINYS